MFRLTSCLAVLVVLVGVGQACGAPFDVYVLVEPPFSDPPFSVSSGYSVDYLPIGSINTTVPSGHPQPNTDVGGDGQWGVNLDYGSTGSTCMTDTHESENVPELALIVGGLADSPYDVYARVMVNSGSDVYGGRLGLSSGDLTSYFASSGGEILSIGRQGKPGQGRYETREFYLGTQNANNGAVAVYLDDFGLERKVGNLAGLRLARIPEPSTLALLAMGTIGLLAYALRKRRR